MKKRLLIILAVLLGILLIPFFGTLVSDAVNFEALDFVAAGAILFALGLTIDFGLRKIKKPNHRIIVVVAVVLVFLLIWAELGVGLFGTPLAGN